MIEYVKGELIDVTPAYAVVETHGVGYGMKISLSTPCVVMTPLIHSMMVVTSPMGEKAPPLLADMMTSAA